MHENLVTDQIIGAAIEVHKNLGPGLLESTYEECLCQEFKLRQISFERQKPLSISYKGLKLDCGYRLDLMVAGNTLVELKAIERIEPIHIAQVLTYLKIAELKIGLIINFNVGILKEGIKRIVNKF